MASDQSDVRRPLRCVADDDAFPLPDYLAPIGDRPQIDVHKFIDSPIPPPPPIPSSPPTQQQQQVQQQHKQPTNPNEHMPRTVIVATLQPLPRVSPPDPLPPPTLSTLLQHLPADQSFVPQPNSTILTITIYNSHSPTKSAQLTLPATTPLITIIDVLPCTARPNLTKTPSPALLYIGNTLYQHNLPGRADYAAPVQRFLRNHSSAASPNIQLITPTSPTFGDLTLTLGLPYPLLHHADCEHLIIFTDIFRSHQQNPAPEIHHRPPRVTPCDVCRRRAADRFTVADPLADASPFHYCGNCFRDAHYSQQGQLFRRTDGFHLYTQHVPL